ncbi:hypothetical protein [Caloramator australicus]|uniref:Uncharacterized protein n=1 Tax=Caloramator australicus RC3 TaxID=857293 RepID=I7KTA7_9CLOT|nr:hypothetical protein [Caloramator australicus]CCJ32938.1 hypothetical protein CAAU_0854 [Caloramator australicus RC3]
MKCFSKCFIIILLISFCLSNLVYAESNNKYVKNQDNSILICNAENLKMITPEEYFKIIANARNISVTEAEKLQKK